MSSIRWIPTRQVKSLPGLTQRFWNFSGAIKEKEISGGFSMRLGESDAAIGWKGVLTHDDRGDLIRIGRVKIPVSYTHLTLPTT